MAEPRRLRRFVAECGTQFDETVDGYLRRLLLRSDKSRIPAPETRAAVEATYGPLREMTRREANTEKGWARR